MNSFDRLMPDSDQGVCQRHVPHDFHALKSTVHVQCCDVYSAVAHMRARVSMLFVNLCLCLVEEVGCVQAGVGGGKCGGSWVGAGADGQLPRGTGPGEAGAAGPYLPRDWGVPADPHGHPCHQGPSSQAHPTLSCCLACPLLLPFACPLLLPFACLTLWPAACCLSGLLSYKR